MARRVVHVLLPTGSKEEARAARAALGPEASLQIGMAGGHSAGQKLYGDVVVVGETACLGIEDDVVDGTVTRYRDMAALERKASPAKADEPKAPLEGSKPLAATAAKPAGVVGPTVIENAGRAPARPVPDELEGLDRVQLIQRAAGKWPGKQSWATMKTDDLRGKIRELEVGD